MKHNATINLSPSEVIRVEKAKTSIIGATKVDILDEFKE